jgi:adsorption protein B
LFYIWYFFRVLFISLVIVFLVSGLDDLFVDLVYYIRVIYRAIFRRHLIRPVTRDQLNACPEKPIAIMVPAWKESDVIDKMLLNTITTLDYRNYHLFVGTYPNDEATFLAVEKIREIYPQVSAVVTPADGPTNKADCLNWVVQGIFAYEKENGVQFDIFVMHDAEDIVHPLSFKYFNYLMPRVHMIQLPVLALEWRHARWVAGIYIDEFAELHSKDLRAREFLTNTVPSAGVGTALSREAIEFLRRKHQHQVFDIRSLTEDYQLGLQLRDMQGKNIFLQQMVERVEARRHWLTGLQVHCRIRDLIATREFFPNNFADAVRQRSRWIMGIAIQGWRMGWTDSLGANYWLFRDRKGLITNLLTLAGYPIVIFWGVVWLLEWLNPNVVIPPLIGSREIYATLMWIVMGLLLWRLINRVVAVGRIYGIGQALLSAPRLVVGNAVNFWATVQAIRRYIRHRISGKAPEWIKTDHAYPTDDQLLLFHRKLGDLLLDRRLITTRQLEQALQEQKKSGLKLGNILMAQGVLWEEDLVSVLAHQLNLKSSEIDPYAASPELLQQITESIARTYRIYPLGIEGNKLLLATDSTTTMARQNEMEELLGRPVAFRMTSSADIQFALARGYALERIVTAAPGERLGELLVKSGKITPDQLREALRRQKRDNHPLGEVLVAMNIITSTDATKALSTQ